MDVCNSTDVSGQPHQSSSTGRQPPSGDNGCRSWAQKNSTILGDVFQSPTKSRHLDVASSIKKECERHRTLCRIRKRKQQICDLAAALEEDETLLAQLDEQIRTLKNTSTQTSINGSILFDVPELLYCRIGN